MRRCMRVRKLDIFQKKKKIRLKSMFQVSEVSDISKISYEMTLLFRKATYPVFLILYSVACGLCYEVHFHSGRVEINSMNHLIFF